jgi:hypothetical protein
MVTAARNVVPPEGAKARVKLVALPAWTVCEDPVPVGARVKSSATSLTVGLVAELKFASPL